MMNTDRMSVDESVMREIDSEQTAEALVPNVVRRMNSGRSRTYSNMTSSNVAFRRTRGELTCLSRVRNHNLRWLCEKFVCRSTAFWIPTASKRQH
jgi:hypothetical protein